MSETSDNRQNIRCTANKAAWRMAETQTSHISGRTVRLVCWLLRLQNQEIHRAALSRLQSSLLDIVASLLALCHRAADFKINSSSVPIQLIPPLNSGGLLFERGEMIISVAQYRPVDAALFPCGQINKLAHSRLVWETILETAKKSLNSVVSFFGHIKSKRVALTPNVES